MHKISNFTGSARHGWEKMTPSMGFGMSRPHPQHDMSVTPPIKRSMGTQPASPVPAPGTIVNLSFNVPFSSNLAGPEVEDVIYASPGAFSRWTFPEGTAEGTPFHKLPVHANNVETLRSLCRAMSENSEGRLQATVTSSSPNPIPGLQRGPLKALVTNVCLSGEQEMVTRMRGRILNDTPISLRCETVDIDSNLIIDPSADGARADVLSHLDGVADCTKADIFLLGPKQIDESASFNGNLDSNLESRLRIVVYGDMESAEHAKTRILIMIDQILGRQVDTLRLELSLHTLVCGRARRNIKLIESATSTAIYMPPPFPQIYGYIPPGATRRSRDEVIITGESQDNILQAKKRIHDLVIGTKTFVKDVHVTNNKLDSILLERLDKIRKIIEANGSYVILPQLGLQQGIVRVQATDILNVERTVREIMALAGQFYSASWWVTHPDPSQRPPTAGDIRAMLSDICINSGAEISFEKLNFHINGSDDAVKAAMMVIGGIPFVKKSQYTMRVKIELANEHKEFRAEPPVVTDSPTRSTFAGDEAEQRSLFDKIRKPGSMGSMSSLSSFLDRRKNGSGSPGSLFKHASSNASKASLVSMESRDSGYRNPWNDSGINLPDDDNHHNGWPLAGTRPALQMENKFPFGTGNFGNGTTVSLPGGVAGDATPKHDARASADSGRPSTSHSASGYPAPIGPPR
ncbi:hypothetical protein LTR16_003556 [Cryomyces antarcticus]|uniref:K Homology domain-containing protein n=1 Tax=Cryomyces antarcticus TaxID=329879 RepID=A0ABR0LY12_9PEZI|nr:hypothetical protein LTR39_001489 [Cryomyces antarcticus]KAK5256306.1 hypothetical protein LTR16_003556 [Cryomyces antarcticus]